MSHVAVATSLCVVATILAVVLLYFGARRWATIRAVRAVLAERPRPPQHREPLDPPNTLGVLPCTPGHQGHIERSTANVADGETYTTHTRRHGCPRRDTGTEDDGERGDTMRDSIARTRAFLFQNRVQPTPWHKVGFVVVENDGRIEPYDLDCRRDIARNVWNYRVAIGVDQHIHLGEYVHYIRHGSEVVLPPYGTATVHVDITDDIDLTWGPYSLPY